MDKIMEKISDDRIPRSRKSYRRSCGLCHTCYVLMLLLAGPAMAVEQGVAVSQNKDIQQESTPADIEQTRIRFYLGLQYAQMMVFSQTKEDVHAEDLYSPEWSVGISYNRYGLEYFDGISLFNRYHGGRLRICIPNCSEREMTYFAGYMRLEESDVYETADLLQIGGDRTFGRHTVAGAVMMGPENHGLMLRYEYLLF